MNQIKQKIPVNFMCNIFYYFLEKHIPKHLQKKTFRQHFTFFAWSLSVILRKVNWEFFQEGVSWTFFRVTLKAFIRIQISVWTIQNYYLDHLRHVRDTFGTIRQLKIIFEMRFSKTVARKWVEIRFLPYCVRIGACTSLFLSSEAKSFDYYG